MPSPFFSINPREYSLKIDAPRSVAYAASSSASRRRCFPRSLPLMRPNMLRALIELRLPRVGSIPT